MGMLFVQAYLGGKANVSAQVGAIIDLIMSASLMVIVSSVGNVDYPSLDNILSILRLAIIVLA